MEQKKEQKNGRGGTDTRKAEHRRTRPKQKNAGTGVSLFCAVLSGASLAAAQCVPALFFLALCGSTFVLWALFRLCRGIWGKKKRYRRSVGIGALFGAVYTAGAYCWLWQLCRADFLPMGTTVRLFVIFGAVLALSCLSALLCGLWALLLCVLGARMREKYRPIFLPLAAGAGWICLEGIQSVTVGCFPVFGLPWIRLAGALVPCPQLLQSAALWGSVGVGGVIVFSAGLLAEGVNPRAERRQRAAALLFWTLLLTGIFGAGQLRMTLLSDAAVSDGEEQPSDGSREPAYTALLVQGNLGAASKWSAEGAELAWERYSSLTEEAPSADLTVWTESAIPLTLERSPGLDGKLCALSYLCDTTLLTGLFHRTDGRVYNSVYAYLPDGSRSDEPYSKRIPVPFGEYLPFPSLLGRIPALAALNVSDDPIFPGTDTAVLDTPAGKVGVLVCFDSAYPEIARCGTAAGAEVLCVLSNSAWFGDSPAARQAVAGCVLRALECGRDVLLSSSSGISAAIDRAGRVTAESRVLETGVLSASYRRYSGKTPYVFCSDRAVCAVSVLVLASISLLTGQKRRKKDKKR